MNFQMLVSLDNVYFIDERIKLVQARYPTGKGSCKNKKKFFSEWKCIKRGEGGKGLGIKKKIFFILKKVWTAIKLEEGIERKVRP